ncbi:MAG: GAF domain-containing sensor histidine kinase [Acidimicrobiia bacterium]|nr:GAF domain-containing sensor histidine kinase [Acidimicrobiia bacterium]
MTTAPLPPNEAERLNELRELEILDTLPEATYDSITFLASQICGVPIALVSIVDEDRQWFKSRVGLDATETHRNLAFCAHAINEPEKILIVPDASLDTRFMANPLVTSDPNIRFYAGAPLVTSSGSALGTLCVIDREPRDLSEDQLVSLRALSVQVMALLELRRTVRELREQQAALEEASRLREVLMGTVSHELRTPLTAIIGFIEFLGEDIDVETRTDIVRRLGRQAGDLQHLVDDLLIAARAEADSLNVETITVDLETQVSLALEDVSAAVAGGISIDTSPCLASGDPARIRQIIRNLLTNAVRYGGPTITLETHRRDDSCRLLVVDDGPGVPIAEREHIFERFRQASTASYVASSAGLGLPISRLLAEKMAGTLTYRYENGRSIFELTLPRAAALVDAT